jgi:hypothetical protein
MQWYFSKGGTQMGPVSLDELRAKIASGEVTGADMVWREGFPDWKRIGDVPELGISSAAAQPMTMTPQAGVPSQASPYHPPAATAYSQGMLIPNYLWQSIVVTIFCCWPLGIPAIVYAAKVDGMKARGDIQGAITASNNAKTWCWVALGAWLVLIVVYIAFAVLVGFSSYSTN